MSHPSTGIGPTFWCDTYGLCTWDDFHAKAQKYVPNLLPFGDFGVDETWLGLAWASPFSAPGVAVAAGLTLEGYSGPEATSGTTLFQQQQTAAVHNAQESTMATLVIPDCFQVTIQMMAGGHPVENVVGVENSGGSALGAATWVQNAWEATLGPLHYLSDLVTVVNYHAVDLSSTTGDIADKLSTGTGGNTGASLATRGACALVQWNGSTRSRSTRGRLYFGPIAESDIQADGATLTSTAQTNVSSGMTTFSSTLAANGYPGVVLSRKLSIATIISGHSVEATIATQRRRIR